MVSSDALTFGFLLGAFLCGCGAFVGLAANAGAVGNIRRGNVRTGFWGAVESSVDWCEENYDHHGLVAELHNTWTSGLIATAGLLTLHNAWRVGAERRYYLASATLAMVGVGSTLFHMTLQRGMQALDEVPMVWLATLGAYCLYADKFPSASQSRDASSVEARPPAWLPVVLAAMLGALTCLMVLTHSTVAVVAFHLSFAPVEVFYFVMAIRLAVACPHAPTRALLRRCFVLYGVAILAWVADIVFCETVQSRLPFNPQLHAYGWHVCVSLATHGLITAMLRERTAALHPGRRVTLHTRWLLPSVSVGPLAK